MRKEKRLRWLVLIVVMCMMWFGVDTTSVWAEEATKQATSTNLGWITIIPPILAIILAFTTKNVILSLFIGVFSGAYILQLSSGVSLLTSFLELLRE